MAIASGDLAQTLKPVLDRIWGTKIKDHPKEYLRIFTRRPSNDSFETTLNISGLGLLSTKSEGASITFDAFKQGFSKNHTHAEYSSGFIITRIAIEDGKYLKQAEIGTVKLARAVNQTYENLAANVLNRAFNSVYTGPDGLELCSTAHLFSHGGTFQNEPTTASDLSEAALEDALIEIAGFKDDRQLPMAVMPRLLVVPRQESFNACRILKSDLRVSTSDNDINAIKSMGMIPEGYMVNHYLTDTDAWFILTDVENGLTFYDRRPPEFAEDTDFDTENLKYKATMRASFIWDDPRCIYGSPGA